MPHLTASGVAHLPSLRYGRTLIESWNGTAWSLASSPNNGTGDNVLDGVVLCLDHLVQGRNLSSDLRHVLMTPSVQSPQPRQVR